MPQQGHQEPMSISEAQPGPVDPAEAAALLRRLLAAVERGEVTGSASMIARIEGAAVALETLSNCPHYSN